MDIWWVGISSNDGMTYTNAFKGMIENDINSGEWSDVPKGTGSQYGTLNIQVNRSPTGEINGLSLLSESGGFGIAEWTKIG